MPTAAAVAGKQRDYYDAVVRLVRMTQARGGQIERLEAFRRVAEEFATTPASVHSAFYKIAREVGDTSVKRTPRRSAVKPVKRNGVHPVDSRADTIRNIAADLRAQANELEKRAAELDELEATDETMRAIRAVVQGVNGG